MMKYVEFDASEYLESDEAIQVFLEDIVESGDPKIIAHAIADVARAKGMTDLAAKAGVSRESLYDALGGEGGDPDLDTMMKVLTALGVKTAAADAAE